MKIVAHKSASSCWKDKRRARISNLEVEVSIIKSFFFSIFHITVGLYAQLTFFCGLGQLAVSSVDRPVFYYIYAFFKKILFWFLFWFLFFNLWMIFKKKLLNHISWTKLLFIWFEMKKIQSNSVKIGWIFFYYDSIFLTHHREIIDSFDKYVKLNPKLI